MSAEGREGKRERKVRKQSIANLLHERAGDDGIRKAVELGELLVEEWREANDTAPVRAMIRNQGKIQGMNELLRLILEGPRTLLDADKPKPEKKP
jgi:hypothetical protein